MSPREDRRLALTLLAPALLVLAVVTLYPVVRVFGLSLERRVPIFGVAEFVGLRHYRFLAGDDAFWNAVRVTLTFAVASVAIEIVLGVAVALALSAQRRGRAVSMALLLLPWCLPGVVTARTWEWLYHPTAGVVNRLAVGVGLGAVNWLGDPIAALPALIVADVWRTTPFMALFAYARLTTIPPAVYEAAAVDGANRWTTLRAITLPLVGPVVLVAGLFRTLDALRVFDLMFVLTGGGPGATTETLTIHAYRNLFQTLQLGLGAAVAVVVFGLVATLTLLYLSMLERIEARR